MIREVRGRGLFVGVELKDNLAVDANHLAKILAKHSLLTKATHDMTIRLAPPLVINESEIKQAVEIVGAGLEDLQKLNEQMMNK